MQVNPLKLDLVKGTIEGYRIGNDKTDVYCYKHRLPSDIVFMMSIPRSDLSEMSEHIHAYNTSTMMLGMDPASFKDINSVHYMTASELSSFLDSLDKLCGLCAEHQKLYESIQKSKEHLRLNYKNYFFSVANSKERVPLKESLVEHVYLKNMFIDKVYLTAAMDIHTYAVKVMSSALSYASENIKKLSG